MAWREARAARGRLAVAAVAMAVAAATMSGVRGVAVQFSRHALDNARQWIASDVTVVYYGQPLTPEQWASVHAQPEIAAATVVSEAEATAYSNQAPDPVTVSLKAVEPDVYPFYGRLELRYNRTLRQVLDDRSAVVSPDVLEALQVHVGDSIRIHRAEFRIRDVVVSEPDQFAIPQAPIGRIIVSDQGLGRSGLLAFGGWAYYRLLARTRDGIDRRPLCSRLEQMFPEAKVIDYTSRMSQTTAAAEWIVPFLKVVALLAMAFGAVGIAAAAYFHILRTEDSIATLKSLGATGSHILSIYCFQTMCLALVGLMAGAACQPLVVGFLRRLAAHYFNTEIDGGVGIGVNVESSLLILAAAIGAALIPLSRIGAIPPSLLLRRDLGEKRSMPAHSNVVEKLRWAAAGAPIAAFVLFRTLHSFRAVAFFTLAIGLAVVGMHLLARITFSALLCGTRAGGIRIPWTVRYGIANLYRHQRRSSMVMVLLTSGVALMLATLLGEARLRTSILDGMPFRAPNLVFLQVRNSQMVGLSQLLAGQSGILRGPDFVPTAWLTLASSDHRTLAALRRSEPDVWIQNTWSASCLDAKPPSLDVISGRWWGHPATENAVALDPELARLFRTSVGGTLNFITEGQPVRARVAALIRIPPAQRLWLHEMVFNCAALPGATYSGALTIAPQHLHRVQQLLREQLPDVVFLDVDHLVQQSQRVGREATGILLLFAGLIVSAAVCLLLAVIQSLRMFRVYEIGVLRCLGARRLKLLTPIVIEYSVLGAISGVAGGLFGCVATAFVLLQATGRFVWIFDLPVILSAVFAAAIAMAAVGLLGSSTLFHPKPLDVLRTQ